jgi:hypothetical protein
VLLGGCGDDGDSGPADVYFDLGSSHDTFDTFWDQPFPSDLRLTAEGNLDVAGYPNQRDTPLVNDLLVVAAQHPGAPLMPVSYVRFAVDVPARDHLDVIPPGADQDVFLVDLASGTMVPIVAETLFPDDFAPRTLVGVAPVPGIVLAPDTTYAMVMRRSFAPDADPPPDFVALRDGRADGAAADVYAPLWPALENLGVAKDDVLVATVFTTGDETRRTFERSEAVRAAHDAVIGTLTIDAGDGAAHDGYCELVGTVTFPQFQRGTPPFDSEGDFELDGDGVPIMQREETVPVVITIPFGEMPANGWPLFQYFHGSGGRALDLVDRGPVLVEGGPNVVGEGPAYVISPHGMAAAAASLPVNPERLPGASDYAYLNIDNLAAFPFTFQQGIFESRLFLDALLELRIDESVLAGCPEVTLPAGTTEHRFDPDKLVASGQSMGAMYTNLVGTVEPRYGALVPTAGGGMWNLMIIETSLIPGVRDFLTAAFATDYDSLNFMQPGLELLALGCEIADPVMAMSRLARRPLDGFAAKNVFATTAPDDRYFSTNVYDASALASGSQQAGEQVWDSMQDVLALDGLDGIQPYPVSNNRGDTTNVVVQYVPDGIINSHNVAYQLDSAKHQYACFLETYLATGTATLVAPGALADPCQ